MSSTDIIVAEKHPLDAHFRLASDESPEKHTSDLALTNGHVITGIVTEYYPDQGQIHIAESRGASGYHDDWVIDIRHVIAIRWA